MPDTKVRERETQGGARRDWPLWVGYVCCCATLQKVARQADELAPERLKLHLPVGVRGDAVEAVSTPTTREREREREGVAPNAGQDKAGQSEFPHFATQAAPGENAEKLDLLSFHAKNRGLTISAARKRRNCGRQKRGNCGKCGKSGWLALRWLALGAVQRARAALNGKVRLFIWGGGGRGAQLICLYPQRKAKRSGKLKRAETIHNNPLLQSAFGLPVHPPCTRVKWVPFVLLAFFPCFIFRFKIGHFPFKT